MNCYIDSSIVLRLILKQSLSLKEWPEIKEIISSRLLRLECNRTINRLKLQSALSDEEIAEGHEALLEIIDRTGLIVISEPVLKRAEDPFATPLGSLDAIHLATAILWRDLHGDDWLFATHDKNLALAARAHDFKVIGV